MTRIWLRLNILGFLNARVYCLHGVFFFNS